MLIKILQLLSLQEKKSFLTLLFMMLIGAILETMGIGLIIPAIGFMTDENFITSHPFLSTLLNQLGNPNKDDLIFFGIIFLFSVYFVKAIYLTFLTWQQNKFIYGVRAALSKRLFYGYLIQPWTFHLEKNSAQLINTLTNETNQFGVYIVQPTLVILSETFIFTGLAILLIWNDPLSTLILIGILCSAIFMFYGAVRNNLLKWGKERQFHETLRVQHVQQGLGGVKEVKLSGLEDSFLESYDKHNQKVSQVMQIQTTIQQQPRIWFEILALICFAIIAYVMVSQGKTTSHIYITLSLFAGAAYRILPSVNKIISAIQSLRYASSVLNLLHNEIIMMKKPIIQNKQDIDFNHAINIENISYRYQHNTNLILNNINLEIKRGECIGLIGSSGSGKSTLVDIILGLLSPESGAILVDGNEIKSNLRSWQKQIGYVPQSIFLTDDTLRRNIAFGLKDELIDEKSLSKAIKMAQLEDFVNSLPEGIQTIVGERGVRLSGGQRQRIGIARALYHDPTVLVLDEASSALDIKTEEEVMDAVHSMIGTKTIIIIAHRLSTLQNCDKIYRIEHGYALEEKTNEN